MIYLALVAFCLGLCDQRFRQTIGMAVLSLALVAGLAYGGLLLVLLGMRT